LCWSKVFLADCCYELLEAVSAFIRFAFDDARWVNETVAMWTRKCAGHFVFFRAVDGRPERFVTIATVVGVAMYHAD
jgi:hypothetical protein